jgi:60 kDa SS-A/Ro ribonucleoprotein
MKDIRNIRSAHELIEFVRTQTASRGWGRGLRTAVSEWYMRQPLSRLAVEVLPDLATHRHIVRRAHPKPRTLAQNAFFQWVTTGELGHLATPEIRAGHFTVVQAVERLHVTSDLHEAVRLIEEYKLAAELVPSVWKQSPRVWEALLPHAAVESLVAHLRSIGESGVFDAPELTAMLIARLSNRPKLVALGTGALESALAEYRAIPRGHSGVEQILTAALRAIAQVNPEANRKCA